MANYYFHPTADQGTGSGDSEANAKAFTNAALATAEGSISSGDTIYFDTSATYVVGGALASQLNYENLDISASTTADPVIIYQLTSNNNRLHNFNGCLFDAAFFFEENGLSGCPRASFTGCVFTQNSNKYFFEHRNGSTNAADCIFTHCTITNPGGVSGYRTVIFRKVNCTLKNCIIVDTTNSYTTIGVDCTVTISPNNTLVQAGGTSLSSDANNLAVVPQFVDSTTGDYRLRPTSPGINAGAA